MVLLRERQGALELDPSFSPPRIDLGYTDVRERVDEDLRVVERSRELQCSLAPRHGFRNVLDDHAALRDVGVGHRERVSRRQPLEELDRLERNRLALPGPPGEEQQS